MSADDLKQKFADVRLRTADSAKLEQLLASGRFKEAAALKSRISGPLPHGQVVSLEAARARR